MKQAYTKPMLSRILSKIKQKGRTGLPGSVVRHLIGAKDHLQNEGDQSPGINQEPIPWEKSPEYIIHQERPQKALRRYTLLEGKEVLEVGGAQACISANAFLRDGANSVTVTGLDHITEESIFTNQRIRVAKVSALELSQHFAPNSFDVVYGLSIIEHIPNPKHFIEQVHYVLKPGGLAFFEGSPLWSSPKGHHLYVSTTEGDFINKTSANYFFHAFAGIDSSNPVPNWGHLLLSEEDLRDNLRSQSIPESDINCIAHWIFASDNMNRLSFREIAKAYTSSGLVVLEANVQGVDVPEGILHELRQKCGDGMDYGVIAVDYLLKKERST
jgi:SAM-dependent methyltransferase